MRKIPFAFALLALASMAAAHEYSIRPVHIQLRIESNQVRARIESSAEYWNEEILHVPFAKPLPAADWPENFQRSARAYVDKSFQLAMDGKPLAPATFECRYTQEPLAPSSARVNFNVVYPIPTVGRQLSGRAQFFKEYYEERTHEKEPLHDDEIFLTRLSFKGKRGLEIDVPFEKPDFVVPLDGLVLTPMQKLTERIEHVIYRLASSMFFWILLGVAVYKVRERYLKRREE